MKLSLPQPEVRVVAWRWPLPAVLAWVIAGGSAAAARAAGLEPAASWIVGSAVGAVLALGVRPAWRRALVALGFPLASLGAGAVPAWLWAAAALPLALAYPLRAWADAPFFPTPRRALRALPGVMTLAPGTRVLDAGCGLGHGLRALRAAWPEARLEGVEWSAPLAWLCALRCRDARVRRGDLWQADWRGLGLVYLFQRPESMARAWAKAQAELAPGAWLVSLEFDVPGVTPWRRVDAGAGRPLWIYRTGSTPGASQPISVAASPAPAARGVGLD